MPSLRLLGRVMVAIACAAASLASAQLAPTGAHYAGRASDTGYGGSFVNATGTIAASIPLDLPSARGGLPIPLQVAYGSRGVGAAGLGWDVPLSYIQHGGSLARRRPASQPSALPVPRERTYLSLLGQTLELIVGGGVWVPRSGTLAVVARQTGNDWLVDDGEGRTFTFERPPTLSNTGLWLLKSISASGGAEVRLDYDIAVSPLNGGTGIEIDLARIRYNSHPAMGCAKNEIALTYGLGSIKPLSMSIVGDRVLSRKRVLTLIDVKSREDCSSALRRLRRYELQYAPDVDTELPRLRGVRMFGREGTAEENAPLPLGSYEYASATDNGKLHYQLSQTIVLPALAAHNEVAGTVLDASINAHGSGDRYAMWQTLTDVTGDGRPDLVFQRNDKLWVAYSAPASNGQTTLGAGAQGIAQLSDGTFAHGPFTTHTTERRRYFYDTANRNTTNVWREAIDVNGDGRIDLIDAAEQPNRWVIYLNTADAQGGVKWERRSFSIKALHDLLVSEGHAIDGDYLPLSRKATGTDLKVFECWRWNGTEWQWFSLGFADHRCQGVENEVLDRGPERTFVEWELDDLNGDGYPDFAFNSSPVDFQLHPPPSTPTPATGAVWPADFGVGGQVWHRFAPRATNEVRASFNVLGVRFFSDHNAFSQSVDVHVIGPEHGVAEWQCGAGSCDESLQSLAAGFADVNGDGLIDRVVGQRAYLGAYHGTAVFFLPEYITLPGPLATVHNTHKEACGPNGNQKPTADQTQGLRDLTGDGIPDYFDRGTVWIGTGNGFRQAIPITVPGGQFQFSHQTETCDGTVSKTDGGLFDIDGDGRPEIVGLGGNTMIISALAGGQTPGNSEAGRLTAIDNGYGARTAFSYVSAKAFTDNPIPFPEIVVGAVSTTGTNNFGGRLAGSRYAYGNAELVFDSVLDRYIFPGYRRSIEVRLYGMQRDKTEGAATITDNWPLTPFASTLTKADRWLRTQRMGRVRDVFKLRGMIDPDPWSLLDVYASDTRVIGVTHYEYGAKLYELPPDPSENVFDCLEMVNPLDFDATVVSSMPVGVDICRSHGFAFEASRDAWYGASPPPSDNNIQTRVRITSVDDFGRPEVIAFDNDVFRSDDDICLETKFASPAASSPRVLNAPSSRRMYDCEKKVTFAGESFEYDGLPAGSVAAGRMTSHSVDRRETSTGALLNTIRVFDATYDAAGNLASSTTQRQGAARTAIFTYDPFGIVQTGMRMDASALPSIQITSTYDPLSLDRLASTDGNGTSRGTDYDGFGRPVRSTVTPPGGALGVVSTTAYLGFATPDPDGRHVSVRRFDTPVPPASVAIAAARNATIFLDEIGRERRTEVTLGDDYPNQALVLGWRTYDDIGRVAFQADPYVKGEDPLTAYGTSYYFKSTGDLECMIRGQGPQPLSMATDLVAERFPTCFLRSFAGHLETLDVRDAASLQSGTAQSDVVRRVVMTAIGHAIERSTLKTGLRLELATFGYDRLGQRTSMNRFADPMPATGAVRWSWQLDSLGETLQFEEPASATRSYRYSDWGEPLETQWLDGAVDRRWVRSYDARGRLIGAEERNDGVTDPETVYRYAYDSGIALSPLVTPAFTLGRLTGAASPRGQVTFSYDAFGRVAARVFADEQNTLYIEKAEQLMDGRLASLEFDLPDLNYAKEIVKYGYDSAGRVRAITYADPSGSVDLYKAAYIDIFGRVREGVYAGNTMFRAAYAPQGRRLIREAMVESPNGARRMIFEQYDALGREMSRREIKDATSDAHLTVAYDVLGRLVRSTKTQGPTTLFDWVYGYDALGNLRVLRDLIGAKGATLSYEPGNWDRVCRIGYGQGGLGGTACNVFYDGVGSTVEQATRTGVRRLRYFDTGRVRSIREGASQASFHYDPFGAADDMEMTGPGATDSRHERRFGGLIERRDQAIGGVSAKYLMRKIPGLDGIAVSRRGASQDWVFQFGERRGNRFFIDQNAAFVQDVDYQPYGESESAGAPPGSQNYTTYQWNGGDSLAPFGLSQLGARVLDPVIGRFLSRDPKLLVRTAGTSNPYAFASNDPFNATDPTGLDCIGQECQPWLPLLPFGWFGGGSRGGSGAAPPASQPPPISTAPYVFNVDQIRYWQGVYGMKQWRFADFTNDWAHEPVPPDPPFMRYGPLGIPLAWFSLDTPLKHAVDMVLLATGVWGIAEGLTDFVISEGVGLTGTQLAGAGAFGAVDLTASGIELGTTGADLTGLGLQQGQRAVTGAAQSETGYFVGMQTPGGGELWTSVGPITQDDFVGLVTESSSNGPVDILTGVHGGPNGAISDYPLFYFNDVGKFENMPNITIHYINRMSTSEITALVNGRTTVIGAFCDSLQCLVPYSDLFLPP